MPRVRSHGWGWKLVSNFGLYSGWKMEQAIGFNFVTFGWDSWIIPTTNLGFRRTAMARWWHSSRETYCKHYVVVFMCRDWHCSWPEYFLLASSMRYTLQYRRFPPGATFTVMIACISQKFHASSTLSSRPQQQIRIWSTHWRHCGEWSLRFLFCPLGLVCNVSDDWNIALIVVSVLYVRSLLSICMMASLGHHYRAKGSRAQCVEDTETLAPVKVISDLVFASLGVSGRMRPGDMLYSGDQFDAGAEVDRITLSRSFKTHMNLYNQ